MRSDLVFNAVIHISNRYQLCQLASKATRKLHKPRARLQETMNDAFVFFSRPSMGSVRRRLQVCDAVKKTAA